MVQVIYSIVEGDGDEQALPILLRKLRPEAQYRRPKNANGRGNLTKKPKYPGDKVGVERFLELVRTERQCDGVLILIDADKDCAAELGYVLAERASKLGLPFPVAIVCAKCEYESWFLASLDTIAGKPNIEIAAGVKFEGEVEAVGSPKGWLRRHMLGDRTYKDEDQSRMTSHLDPELARTRSRSFRRLEHALDELLLGGGAVTPQRQKGD